MFPALVRRLAFDAILVMQLALLVVQFALGVHRVLIRMLFKVHLVSHVALVRFHLLRWLLSAAIVPLVNLPALRADRIAYNVHQVLSPSLLVRAFVRIAVLVFLLLLLLPPLVLLVLWEALPT